MTLVYTEGMTDREHEEWLEDRNARRAAAKKNSSKPPIPPKKADDKKREDGDDGDLNGRIWRGEAA